MWTKIYSWYSRESTQPCCTKDCTGGLLKIYHGWQKRYSGAICETTKGFIWIAESKLVVLQEAMNGTWRIQIRGESLQTLHCQYGDCQWKAVDDDMARRQPHGILQGWFRIDKVLVWSGKEIWNKTKDTFRQETQLSRDGCGIHELGCNWSVNDHISEEHDIIIPEANCGQESNTWRRWSVHHKRWAGCTATR